MVITMVRGVWGHRQQSLSYELCSPDTPSILARIAGYVKRRNEGVRFPWPKNHKRQMLMRMRGLEPPRGFPHTDLNRARLPIPPHPRGRTSLAVPFAT